MARDPSEVVQTMIMSTTPPTSPSIGEISSPEKDAKTTLRKVQIFRRISTRRPKKECHEGESSDGKSSVRSEDAPYIYPLDTDSLDDTDEGESEEGKDSNIEKSFGYGTLAYVNHAGTMFYSNGSSSEDEDLVFYTNSYKDTTGTNTSSVPDHHASHQSPIHKILPWRKRKLSFRSSKAKAEPLLKKYYGDEGGDDIDYDRRQLSSSDESNFGVCDLSLVPYAYIHLMVVCPFPFLSFEKIVFNMRCFVAAAVQRSTFSFSVWRRQFCCW